MESGGSEQRPKSEGWGNGLYPLTTVIFIENLKQIVDRTVCRK